MLLLGLELRSRLGDDLQAPLPAEPLSNWLPVSFLFRSGFQEEGMGPVMAPEPLAHSHFLWINLALVRCLPYRPITYGQETRSRAFRKAALWGEKIPKDREVNCSPGILDKGQRQPRTNVVIPQLDGRRHGGSGGYDLAKHS